ncbi:hypothetical protein P3T23_008577 [Paraburkholderia sp. GAS448]
MTAKVTLAVRDRCFIRRTGIAVGVTSYMVLPPYYGRGGPSPVRSPLRIAYRLATLTITNGLTNSVPVKKPPSELTPQSWTVFGQGRGGWVLYITGLSPFNFSLMRLWL